MKTLYGFLSGSLFIIGGSAIKSRGFDKSLKKKLNGKTIKR